MQSQASSYYVHRIKQRLVAVLATPATSRLLWLPLHASIAVLATVVIARGWVGRPGLPALSLAIGLAFAGLMFLGHETMHGAVVRGRTRWARSLVGALCFAPLLVSPRLWTVWHNRMHHGHANQLGVDPDMYPSLAAYRASRVVRFTTDQFAPGGRRWRGVLSLVIGFSVQAAQVLVSARTRLRVSAREHRRMLVETALLAGLWLAVANVVGVSAFVFAYVLPVVVANAVVMAFILTNHSLSPANETNDPLLGALSVTTPRWIEWLTLGFGYHVEHHLFPAASARHARAIRAAIVDAWPERYQAMPLGAALAQLFQTGRVYQDATTLVDPRSGGAWPTLGLADPSPTSRQPQGDDMRLSAENLQGRTVISADGQAVGAIKSVFLDAAEWRVEAVSVELRKEVADRIGANHSLFHRGLIELPVRLIQSVGDAVVLGVAVDALREAHRPAVDAPPPP